MTSIIVTHENNEMDEYDFDVEVKTITVGRRSTNDVCVPHLSVSGVHCKITINGEGTMIEDRNSTNGTYINGRLISRQLLNDGDDIVIGKARLTFLQPENLIPHNDSVAATPATIVDNNHHTTGFDSAAVADSKEPLSLAEKAALNLRPAAAATAGAAVAGVTVANSMDDDVAVADRSNNSNEASEFAGDYYEPDDHEIKAMISDAPEDDLDSDAFDEAENIANSQANVEPFDADGMDSADDIASQSATPQNSPMEPTASAVSADNNELSHVLDYSESPESSGAVIEIKNGAKSGQVLPIDKPVTTLGRPGIQIAAIMKKPEGYFLMHIESENIDERPRLNDSMIGDDPVMLNSGDSLNVAGIDVEFMLS